MSYNQPYRNASNDKDLRMYSREASGYRSGLRSTSPQRGPSSSSELSVFPPNKALSFLHSCGLDAEDLQTLAKLPEHLITTETLPDLLAEIKKKKLSNTPSSRSSALSASSSAHAWDNRSHAQSVEYPLNLPEHQSYSLNREQAQTWDDRWGDQSSSTTASSYVVEYNHLKEKKPYYDELSHATEPSRGKTSAASQSYSNYGRDVVHSSHFSSKDIGQSSHLSSRDGQSSHRSSRDINQSSQLSSRYIDQCSQRSSRDVLQSSQMSSRGVWIPPVLSRDVVSPSTPSNRNVGIPSLLSMRDLAPSSRLSNRDAIQSSWRNDAAPRVPTRKEASDFHGRTPPVFPYACMLCEITVLSNKDWSVHINGPQHANSQLSLVEKYPAWDQTIRTARRNETESSGKSKSRKTQEQDRTSTSRNGSSASRSGTLSSRTTSSSSKNQKKSEAPSKCKVVSVKFEVDGVDEAYLKQLLGQFGAIVKMIMFPRLALVEMGTPSQAEDIVKYFLQNPLKFKGVLLEFSLSAAFSFLQSSRVVSFSPLPSGEGVSSELTAIAKRFGTVKKSLFLPSRGYVEMALVEEANKLVDHYSTNSLKLKGKAISVTFSSEYQSFSDMNPEKDKSPTYSSRRKRRSYSPRRSSRRDSPSPKRRTSDVSSKSSRSHDSNRQDKSRRSHTSSRQDSSSKSHSKRSSPSKDQKPKTVKEGEEEKIKEENDQSDNMDGDSDLEGVAVIADDGEELNSEDELTVDEDIDDEIHDSSDDLNDAPEDMQIVSESTDQTIPSDMDALETVEVEQTSITLEKLSKEENEEAQESQQDDESELQQREQKELQLEEHTEDLQEEKQKEEHKENLQGEQKEEKKESQQEEQKELKEEKQAEELQQEKQKNNLQPGELEEVLQQGERIDETVPVKEREADFAESLEQTEQGDGKEISASSTEGKYGRVLEVAGFPVAKKYSEADLLKIGEKYGDVAGCCLVRSNRKVEKALIEMVNAADAAKLEAECKRQHIKLGGKILRIKVSQEYSQLDKGNSVDPDSERAEDNELMKAKAETLSVEENKTEPEPASLQVEESTAVMAETESSEEAETQMETNSDSIMQTSSDEEEVYGRVLRVRNLPMPDEYSDADFLSIAEPYGTVKRHWMFRLHRTGLIEMENASDADKVLSAANMNQITVAGKHPKISVSTKHAHLNKRYFLHAPSELEKTKDESTTVSADGDGTGIKAENSDSVSETPTILLDPAGMEFVRPVVGYFCNLCNVIYANEEEAKGEHCRTPLHHQKLKEHNERNSSA